MNRRHRSDSQHLDDAASHLRVLQEHLTRGDLDDPLIRDAVSHRLEVAIDSVAKITQDLLNAEAPEDWPKIVGMRNILAHQYAELDEEILRNTIDNRLQGFIELVDRLRSAAAAQQRDATSGQEPPAGEQKAGAT